MEEFSRKSWLATLTEKSSVLLNTEDIAAMLGYSYHHVYKEVVSQPDFPSVVEISRDGPKVKRRWLAGDVVKYLHDRKKI